MSGEPIAWSTKVRAAALVLAAALRLAYWSRRVELLDLPARLRRRRSSGLGTRSALRDGRAIAAGLRRLDHVLPPRRLGPCLRQSLLLVDLLSRYGVEARLHCGLRRVAARRAWEGHAWVTVDGKVFPHQPARPPGFSEIWSA